MTIRKNLRSLFSRPKGPSVDDACVFLGDEQELEAAIASRDKLMVLFYASWCPFSQAFLSIYLAHAAAGEPCYARIIVDTGDPIVEKYSIDVFPTVLFFEKGVPVHRLDGSFHQGLSQVQLKDFARRCAVK